MSSHLSQSEKGGFHICLYFFFPLSMVFSVYLLQNEGGFDACAYWLSPSQLSCLPTFRKMRKGGFNMCLFLVFPLSCHSTHR